MQAVKFQFLPVFQFFNAEKKKNFVFNNAILRTGSSEHAISLPTFRLIVP